MFTILVLFLATVSQPGQYGLGDQLGSIKSSAKPVKDSKSGLDETDASNDTPETICDELNKHSTDPNKQTVCVPVTPNSAYLQQQNNDNFEYLPPTSPHQHQQLPQSYLSSGTPRRGSDTNSPNPFAGHSRSTSLLHQIADKRIADLKLGFNEDDSVSPTNTFQSSTHLDELNVHSPAPTTRRHRFGSYIPSFPPMKYNNENRPIEEHGLVGNMKTCALIGTDAELTWFCYPHFDSPSVFGSMLDPEKGGYWRIRSAVEANEQLYGEPVVHKQLYHSETNVLISRFLTETGVAQVSDYMPVGQQCSFADGWLVREIEVVRGKMYFEIEVKPAFNYALDDHTVQLVPYGCKFVSKNLTLVLSSHRKYKYLLTNDSKGVLIKIKLSEGQKTVFILRELLKGQEDECNQSAHPTYTNAIKHRYDNTVSNLTHYRQTNAAQTTELTDFLRKSTIDYWRSWLSKCTYKGRWREAIYRSALVLKLLTFEPTGAIGMQYNINCIQNYIFIHTTFTNLYTCLIVSIYILQQLLPLLLVYLKV